MFSGSIPAVFDVPRVQNLQSLPSSTGNKNTLVNRLRDSGFVIVAPDDERTQIQSARGSQDSNIMPAHQDHKANLG